MKLSAFVLGLILSWGTEAQAQNFIQIDPEPPTPDLVDPDVPDTHPTSQYGVHENHAYDHLDGEAGNIIAKVLMASGDDVREIHGKTQAILDALNENDLVIKRKLSDEEND